MTLSLDEADRLSYRELNYLSLRCIVRQSRLAPAGDGVARCRYVAELIWENDVAKHETSPMTNAVLLRNIIASDLPIFFEQQLDPIANQIADFPARDREAFMAHWAKILADETNILKTILFDGQVAKHNLASLRLLEKCGFMITPWKSKSLFLGSVRDTDTPTDLASFQPCEVCCCKVSTRHAQHDRRSRATCAPVADRPGSRGHGRG